MGGNKALLMDVPVGSGGSLGVPAQLAGVAAQSRSKVSWAIGEASCWESLGDASIPCHKTNCQCSGECRRQPRIYSPSSIARNGPSKSRIPLTVN